jgi:hypothetical protein
MMREMCCCGTGPLSMRALILFCCIFSIHSWDHVMYLRGGGKFPLMRMVKNEMQNMDQGHRLAIYDKIHKALPFLDEVGDPEALELKR